MSNLAIPNQVLRLKEYLTDVGYKQPFGAVVENYAFVTGPNRLERADLLACADPVRYDISTSCIVVRDWPNGEDKMATLRGFSCLGAPLAFLTLPDVVEVWPIRKDAQLQQPQIIAYDQLAGYFAKHKTELAPRSLLNAKSGQIQLSFFEVDPTLLTFAREITQNTLVERFEAALDAVPSRIREKESKAVTHLAIWVLAACILQDKMPSEFDATEHNIQTLLKKARQRFPNYFGGFQSDIRAVGQETVNNMYTHLRGGGFVFRSLTNDMLAYFYENTLEVIS